MQESNAHTKARTINAFPILPKMSCSPWYSKVKMRDKIFWCAKLGNQISFIFGKRFTIAPGGKGKALKNKSPLVAGIC
jgi:hypothetical protein